MPIMSILSIIQGIVLIILIVVSIFDIKYKQIHVATLAGLLLLAVGSWFLLGEFPNWKLYLTYTLIESSIYFIMRKSIGAGDWLLLNLLFFYCGVYGVLQVISFTILGGIVCCVIGSFRRHLRKAKAKTKTESEQESNPAQKLEIPLAPLITFGYLMWLLPAFPFL